MLAASIAKARIPLAIGSDGPINPYLNLMLATARPDQPAESLTREDALRAYTSGSAFAENQETKKGKIARGHARGPRGALPGHPRQCRPRRCRRRRSVLTIIDGKVVHEE